MEYLGEWIAGVGTAALLGGLVCAVSPHGSCSKALKVSVTLTVLACAVLPLADADIDFSAFDELLCDATAQVGDGGGLIEDSVENTLELAVSNTLAEYGVGDCAVTVRLKKNGESIKVGEIHITGGEGIAEKRAEISEKIIEVTGAETVTYENVG